MGHQVWRDQRGQGVVEYGLLVLLVSVTVFAILIVMGWQFGNIFSSIQSGI